MKRRNLFMSSTIMCGLCCIAFTFDSNGAHWLWADAKPVAVILAIVTVILGWNWFTAAKAV